MVRRLPVLVLAAFALTGCGGSHQAASTSASCASPAQTKALAGLQRDLAALKTAGAIHVKDTLHGGAAVNRATDRFLNDLALAPIDNLTRNRLLDHAIASVIASCQQCFQAFEASRPIPSVAHEGTATSCAKKP